MTLKISKFRRLLPLLAGWVVAVFAVACSPLTFSPPSEDPVGRARTVPPPAAWLDLGTSEEAIAGSRGRTSLQNRNVALLGAQGERLDALRVQTNGTSDLRGSPQGAACSPMQHDVPVKDVAEGSPARADYLRFKLWASSPKWSEKSRPDFVQWMTKREIAPNSPYAYMGYSHATEAGVWVVVDALADQRPLSPRPRKKEETLVMDRHAQQWAYDLAQDARLSSGMLDGHLAILSFPFPAANSRT